MTETPELLEVACEVASDLRRWARAFSGLTGFAVDFERAAEQLDDAIKAEEERRRTRP